MATLVIFLLKTWFFSFQIKYACVINISRKEQNFALVYINPDVWYSSHGEGNLPAKVAPIHNCIRTLFNNYTAPHQGLFQHLMLLMSIVLSLCLVKDFRLSKASPKGSQRVHKMFSSLMGKNQKLLFILIFDFNTHTQTHTQKRINILRKTDLSPGTSNSEDFCQRCDLRTTFASKEFGRR